jgi:hypothetical protein
LADQEKNPRLRIVGFIFLGMLSFTKTEGMVAAGILCALALILKKDKKQSLGSIVAFAIAALPTIIFALFIAPKNVAMINGLTSIDHPSNWERLQVIAIYPWLDFKNPQWNGLWFLGMGGLILAGKNAWQGHLKIIGLFIIAYLGIVMAYYFVNTFFPIVWWLQTTFDRITFALIPTITLWITLSLEKKMGTE